MKKVRSVILIFEKRSNHKRLSDWLIELSDHKLSENNLASGLMENRSFLNQ